MEDENISSSFFESAQFGTGQSSGPDIPDVDPFSFKPDLNIVNYNNINNPWDPPIGGPDISNILCMPLILFFYNVLLNCNANKLFVKNIQ